MKKKICVSCGEEKSLDLFERTCTRGRKFGFRAKCTLCRSRSRKRKIKPITSKFDPRFKWSEATYEEKIKRAKQVFEDHVVRKEGCWDWKGTLSKGYGYSTFNRRPFHAHRLSWLIHNGPIPEGKLVLHRCDNPICTKPSHLFLGTHKDNWHDSYKKGRRNIRHGSQVVGSKLTERKVKNIRKYLREGKSIMEVAVKYKISTWTVEDIKNYKTWKHVE